MTSIITKDLNYFTLSKSILSHKLSTRYAAWLWTYKNEKCVRLFEEIKRGCQWDGFKSRSPLKPRHQYLHSPDFSLCISCDNGEENLFNNQSFSGWWSFFTILMILMNDSAAVLWGEIILWSLLDFQGLSYLIYQCRYLTWEMI